ncbi:MAG: hypothetical protein AB7V45_03375 [Candidatus Krumholzibacteriia bacterium]
MKLRAIALVAVAAILCMAPATGLALNGYSQDFESLNQADTSALGNDGWLVFANVFGPDWSYWYGYGVFPAPNDGAAFSAIASGEGGAAQGMQQLVAFSDYNNANHADGAHIESLLFHEQTIGAGDVGETWTFVFDAKLGNLELDSTAWAFIKTLNPAAGYATTNNIQLDMTAIPSTWSTYSITINIDASLVGQLLQFGFGNFATLYQGSGVFYDNIIFYADTVIPTEDASFGEVKALFR